MCEWAVFDLARVIKAHGGRRDEALWSASLRGRTVSRGDRLGTEIAGQGLLLLDLSTNHFTGHAHAVLAAAIEGDSWLLGLRMTAPTADGALGVQHARTMILNPALVALVLADKPSSLLRREPESQGETEEVEVLRTLASRPWPCVSMPPLVGSVLRDWRAQNESFLRRAEAKGGEEPPKLLSAEGRPEETGQPTLLGDQLPRRSPVSRDSKNGATALAKDKRLLHGQTRHSVSGAAGTSVSSNSIRPNASAATRRGVTPSASSRGSLDRRFLQHELPSRKAAPLSADPSTRPTALRPTAQGSQQRPKVTRAASRTPLAQARGGPSRAGASGEPAGRNRQARLGAGSQAARSHPQSACEGTKGASLKAQSAPQKPSSGSSPGSGSVATGNVETTALIQQLVTRMGHMTQQVSVTGLPLDKLW